MISKGIVGGSVLLIKALNGAQFFDNFRVENNAQFDVYIEGCAGN